MAKSKHNQRSFIPQYEPQKINAAPTYINKNFTKLDSWIGEGDDVSILVSLRYVQHDYQCFSDWDKKDMGAFWAFIRKIHDYTWNLLYSQARKKDKAGLGYTIIPLTNYPNSDFKSELDPEITLFELRVGQKSRVHCFRHKSICYICWLDRNHELT